jgi:hypothetical protein
MVRVATLVLGAVVLLPATSHAADPLLSGYGGPGGGEQVVLGSTTVGGGGNGGNGTSTSAAATDPSQQSLRAPISTAATTKRAAGTPSRSRARKPHRSAPSSNGSASVTATPADATRPATTARPGAPAVLAYPSRASDAGGLPLSIADVLLGLAALAALVLAGLGLRRLADGLDDRSVSPQVSAR